MSTVTGSRPPMLAKNWEPSANPTGWWMSEKLDGVRAIWDGSNFLTRSGKVLHAPDWFKQGMPALPLDGELFTGRGRFNETVSIVRSMTANWTPVKFLVFDVQIEGPFEHRYKVLTDTQLPMHVRIVQQVCCSNPAHLESFERYVISQAGEGVMLRAAGSSYQSRRSPDLRKLKRFHDCEATVTGHEPGVGKHEGRLGALVCRLADGTEFRCGTGFTDRQRETPPAVGSVVTVRYFELTPAGVPRFPAFLTVRDYE